MTLDEPVSEELVLNVISTIFKNSKVTPEIRIDKGANVGEGFLGITASVQVKIGDEVRHFFVKMMPKNTKLRKRLCLEKVFDREVSFFSELYPLLNDIFTKYMKRKFDLTPKCYLIKTDYLEEAIVFDHIGVKGYSARRGKEPLNKDHIMLTLKTYSYLHASGFLFKRDFPDKFQEMLKTKQDLFFDVIGIYDIQKLSLFCLDIARTFCSNTEDKVILDNLNTIKSKILEVDTYHGNSDKEYSTIIHIDCWRNNLMFKYQNNSNELEDLKLVDMQMWTVDSPVFDILHVIYSNVIGNENLELLDFYFHYYYESLRNVVSEMGGNPDLLYPQNIYLSHLKKYSIYGLFMASTCLRPLLTDSKDIPNIAEVVLQDKPLGDIYLYNLPNEEDYSRKLKVIMKHLIKNNII